MGGFYGTNLVNISVPWILWVLHPCHFCCDPGMLSDFFDPGMDTLLHLCEMCLAKPVA